VEKTAIPTAFFSMLQALPDTALWHRLEKEGRMRGDGNINNTTLMNFVPTRPIEEITREFIDAFWQLYDPMVYLNRTYRHFVKLGNPPHKASLRQPSWAAVRALLTVCWRQGVRRNTRWQFWRNFFGILRHNPRVWDHYLSICALSEHFLEYRKIVRSQLEDQLERFLAQEAQQRQETVEAAVEQNSAA
jgi:radical SAM superfamily enzyme YgiQ (UPF0313 family)